ASLEIQLGTVGKAVLDGVVVEVLVDSVAAIMPAAGSLRLHRPGVFHPATLIEVVNQVIAVNAAAGPEKGVELFHLVEQLTDIVRLRSRVSLAGLSTHAVGLQEDQLTDLPGTDPVVEFLARRTVPARQTDADFEVALLGFLSQLEHAARARPIHRQR